MTKEKVNLDNKLRYEGVRLANSIVQAPLTATVRARILADLIAFAHARLEQVVAEDPDDTPPEVCNESRPTGSGLASLTDDIPDDDLSFLD